jgi:hypothetical protein
MKILLKPRASGKTTEAIKLAAKTHAYIVCKDRQRCFEIIRMADDMGLNIRNPVSFREVLQSIKKETRPTGFVNNIIIDDAEMFLQFLFSTNLIDMITMSEKDAK